MFGRGAEIKEARETLEICSLNARHAANRLETKWVYEGMAIEDKLKLAIDELKAIADKIDYAVTYL